MPNFTRGRSFTSTEELTNTKLHTLVEDAAIGVTAITSLTALTDPVADTDTLPLADDSATAIRKVAASNFLKKNASAIFDAGTTRVTGVATPSAASDATTKTYVDTADALKVAKAGDSMTGALAMGSNKITGLGTPTLSADATTKTYVDTADSLQLNLAGGTMSGAINMGGTAITNLLTPSAGNDAANKTYTDTNDALKVSKTGDSMTGALAMGSNKITSLGTPTVSTDAVTKAYVDNATFVAGNLPSVTSGDNGSTLKVLSGTWSKTSDLTIDASGNVGVGTSSPSYKLQVTSNTNDALISASGAADNIGLRVSNTQTGGKAYRILAPATGSGYSVGGLVFEDQAVGARMTIDSSGNVGIGTASPAAKLDVSANARVGQGQITADTTVGNLGIYGGLASATANAQLSFFGKSVSNTGLTYEIGRISGLSAGTYSLDGGIQFSTASNNGSNVLTLAERLRIDSSGNVGIGTALPVLPLNVVGTAGISGTSVAVTSVPSTAHASSSTLRVGLRGALTTSDNASLAAIGTYLTNNAFFRSASGNIGYITTNPASAIALIDNTTIFRNAPSGTQNTDITFTESMRIDSSGNLLVGGTNTEPAGNSTSGVAIKPPATSSNGMVEICNANLTALVLGSTTGDATLARFRRAGSVVGSIDVTAGGTAFTTTSDYRLKTNLEPISNGIERIKQLPVYRFNWKIDEGGNKVDGFVAHEAKAIVPESVVGEKDAVDADGKPIYQGIDQSKIVPLLTAALKEAIAKIETLEAKVTALEAEPVAPEVVPTPEPEVVPAPELTPVVDTQVTEMEDT